MIGDPYLDAGEEALRWMHDIDWRYATALDPLTPTDAGERLDLVFEGIDTMGTVRLRAGSSEVELGRTYNMHRSYRFDLSPHLSGGPIRFHSVRTLGPGRGRPRRRPTLTERLWAVVLVLVVLLAVGAGLRLL